MTVIENMRAKPHQFVDEKIVDADVKYVRKVERSVDRGANMGLEKAETWGILQAKPEN